MKKLLTIAVLIGAISTAEAQNTFPSTGNAGIGITIPAYKLDVGPSSPADGIRITQLSSGSSALHLSNISGTHGTYGNMWSFYSSGASDSWMGGLGNFAISKTSTGGSINTAPGTNSPNFFIQGSSGNVGVNTISPANRLEVAAASAGDGIRISQPGTGATGLHFSPSTGHLWSFYSLGSSDGWGGAGGFAIQDVTGNPSLPRFFITAAGKVAVGGGYSPASQFEVSTSSVDDGAAIVQQTTYASCLKLSHSSAPQGIWSLKAFGASNTEGSGNFGIYDNNAQATRLLVNSAGNVVVGASAPMSLAKLQVIVPTSTDNNAFDVWNSTTGKTVFRVKASGVAYVNELNIYPTGSTFPDYVFKSDYKLRKLDELESYINKNHHLPNIPTADVVEKDGVNVGELQRLQMEKIEELTLYIIQLKKEIDELKKSVK